MVMIRYGSSFKLSTSIDTKVPWNDKVSVSVLYAMNLEHVYPGSLVRIFSEVLSA